MTRQQSFQKSVDSLLAFRRQLHLSTSSYELFHLGYAESLQVLHADDHSPADATIPAPSRSGSSRVGITPPVQAHHALESHLPFRLILHWKILRIDRWRRQ